MDWLRAWVKGDKVGGFTPCIDLLKEYVLHFKWLIRRQPEGGKGEMEIRLLAAVRIKVDDNDDVVGTIIRPFVKGENLFVV